MTTYLPKIVQEISTTPTSIHNSNEWHCFLLQFHNTSAKVMQFY